MTEANYDLVCILVPTQPDGNIGPGWAEHVPEGAVFVADHLRGDLIERLDFNLEVAKAAFRRAIADNRVAGVSPALGKE